VERIIMTFGSRIFALLALAIAVASCTVNETEVPALSGPSELALSLDLQASPDQILQNGREQSVLTMTARGPNSQPVRNLSIRVDMLVGTTFADFGTLSARTVVTGEDGVARATYTAPPAPADPSGPGTGVTFLATPLGSDFRGATARQVDIRVIPGDVIRPPNGTPQPKFSFSPTAPLAFQGILFDASTTLDEGVECGTRCSYTWSFGDGGSASGITATHEYRAAGAYNVTLRVTDDRGTSAQTSQAVNVTAGTPPSASFVYSPTTPVAGQQIFFTAEASRAGPGRHIVSYDWNFGSGRTGSGVTVAKQYDQAGSYVVTLTVTDDAFQQSTVSQTITVTP
jgi:chitodextrinase